MREHDEIYIIMFYQLLFLIRDARRRNFKRRRTNKMFVRCEIMHTKKSINFEIIKNFIDVFLKMLFDNLNIHNQKKNILSIYKKLNNFAKILYTIYHKTNLSSFKIILKMR